MDLARILAAALLAVVVVGLPWLAYRTHAGGRIVTVPRPAIYLSSVLSQWLLFALLVGVTWLERGRLAGIGLDARLGLTPMLGWAAATLAAALIVAAIARGLRLAAGQRESAGVLHVLPRTPGERALFALVVAPTAGLVEEALFRGFALARLKDMVGLGGALTLSTAAFAAGHAFQGPLGVFRVAALGLVLAAPVVATGSLWPGILAHTAFDMLGGTVLARWLAAEPRTSS